MSRIIVKGLPKYLTEGQLKDHFAAKGDVTDVKLMKNKFGDSRRFAFIGYRDTDEAEKAMRYFDGSFIDTAKISVELAKTFADPTVPLSWKEKKRLQEEQARSKAERLEEEAAKLAAKKAPKRQKISELVNEEISGNVKLKEFMEVMKPSHEAKSWANDATVDGSGAPSSKELEIALAKQDGTHQDGVVEKTLPPVASLVKEAESDDEYEEFGAKKDEIEGDEDDDEIMVPLDNSEEQNTEGMSDFEWLKHRQKRIRESEAEARAKADQTEQKSAASSQEAPVTTLDTDVPPPVETEQERAVKLISETGRLFLRNISYTAKEADFSELFGEFGDLEEVHIAVDTRNGTSKGFAYIQFAHPPDAVEAFSSLDKEIFQGRLLHILPAAAKKSHRLDEFELKNLPLKKQRELKKKADASRATFSWNSLYMSTDAVLDSVAASMGVSKADLINPESSSSAVKQALAEASVIGDVRKYFETKGVDLTSFERKEKDDRVILVKNFPFGTTIQEIADLFTPFGELRRLLMPTAGTIAIVEFRDVPSGRAAFTKLAFRRFKKSIIYLEKGPKDLFTRDPTNDEVVGAQEQTAEEEVKEAKISSTDLLGETANESAEQHSGPTVSVFVKNLNFNTTKEQLAQVFKSLDGFVVATIKTKPDSKQAGKTLSMGFGFVEFKTKDQADVAIKTLDGHVLEGHKLQLKLSTRASAANPAKKSGSTKSSKIIVKNLPFEATRKDIVELFSSFGQLKSVRVPKKFDKSARGFAFVEFSLLKEAEQAMDQLTGVHLLGRRLVMQFAAQEATDVDDEIDRMTAKVKRQVDTTKYSNASRLTGKRKLDLDDDDETAGF